LLSGWVFKELLGIDTPVGAGQRFPSRFSFAPLFPSPIKQSLTCPTGFLTFAVPTHSLCPAGAKGMGEWLCGCSAAGRGKITTPEKERFGTSCNK